MLNNKYSQNFVLKAPPRNKRFGSSFIRYYYLGPRKPDRVAA